MGDFIQSILLFLTNLGYLGIALGLMIEIIPSEIVLAYAGYLVSQGHINFLGAMIAGVIGGTIAQLFIYWIGKYGGRPFLEKYGKYLFIHKKHIDISEAWFNKYGTGVIFAARFVPVVRHAISIPAGISNMSLKKFIVYTTLAIIPWSFLFIYLGDQLSSNWQNVNEFAQPYVQPAMIIAVILIIVYLLVKTLQKRKH